MQIASFNPIFLEQCQLSPGGVVVAGVSGGADSLCLLDLLVQAGYPVVAAHFNHHLRAESDRDEEVARAAAAQVGAEFTAGQSDVASWAHAEKRSLEEAARIFRYRFLFEQARLAGAQAVAVGHTASDQVETVLMHLLQGSGLAGLAGMAFRDRSEWDPDIPLVRPLLDTWRADTEAHCRARGLAFASDASNQDPSFTRNRVRLQLIPMLESYNPAVKQAIHRTARVLAGEEEIVAAAVQAAWEECLDKQQPDSVVFWLARLRKLGRPLQRALVRRAAAQLLPAGTAQREVAFDDVERAVNFLKSASRSGQINFVQGIWLAIEPGRAGRERLLVFGPGQEGAFLAAENWPQVGAAETVVPVPGVVALRGGWELRADWVDLSGGKGAAEILPRGAWEIFLDGDSLADPLVVCAARPGERFKPLGMDGNSVKLSDFWINEKLPRRARSGWPLVCSADEVVWVPGFRPAHPYRISEHTRRVLHLKLSNETM